MCGTEPLGKPSPDGLRQIKHNDAMTFDRSEMSNLAATSTTGCEPVYDVPRSLVSTARLYGSGALHKLASSHVAVVGLGGVGSWAAEALVRSGVGRLTLIDSDHVSESNLNRQVQAVKANLGMSKVDALGARLLGIGQPVQIQGMDIFLSQENLEQLLAMRPDFWIDACDDRKAKQLLIQALPTKLRTKMLVVCGAAGGKTDPTRIRRDDLAQAQHDPLLARLRTELRRTLGSKRAPGARLHVPVIYSQEPVRRPLALEGEQPSPSGLSPGGFLACAGYGSSVAVTAAMGMTAAAWAIECLIKRPPSAEGL